VLFVDEDTAVEDPGYEDPDWGPQPAMGGGPLRAIVMPDKLMPDAALTAPEMLNVAVLTATAVKSIPVILALVTTAGRFAGVKVRLLD